MQRLPARLTAVIFAPFTLAAIGCGADSTASFDGPIASPIDAMIVVFPDARITGDAPVLPPSDGPLGSRADAAANPDGRLADARLADGPRPDGGFQSMACNKTPGVPAITIDTSTVFYAQTFAGATDAYSFHAGVCGSDPPDSVERIYTFELTRPTEFYAETRCGSSSTWDCELVLTKNGCGDADVLMCQASIGNEVMSGVLQPGSYTLFVEGDNPEDPAPYDLMVNFNHTEGQAACAATDVNVMNLANCVDPDLESPQILTQLPSQVLSPTDRDDFFVNDIDGCTNDESHVGGGPDRVYSFTLPSQRDVQINMTTYGWDGLLYVTRAPCGAAAAVQACSDDLTGSEETIDVTLSAGTWYVVVDGFGEETFDGNAWGTFDLEFKVYDDVCDE